jgi:hypothetical protein
MIIYTLLNKREYLIISILPGEQLKILFIRDYFLLIGEFKE